MSGFWLKRKGLRNIPYGSSIQESLRCEESFELEYFFEGQGNFVVVEPIAVNTVVIFLVHFPEGGRDSMALVYNKKDVWSDIDKESTGLTKAIGNAIGTYYSNRYLLRSNAQKEGLSRSIWETHLLN